MLTKNDLQKIEEIVDEELESKFNEKLAFLPSKDYFTERMDKLSGEIQDMRDEFTLHQGKHDEIEERLSTVEQKLGIQPL